MSTLRSTAARHPRKGRAYDITTASDPVHRPATASTPAARTHGVYGEEAPARTGRRSAVASTAAWLLVLSVAIARGCA